MRLDELDARYLPAAADRVRRWADRLAAWQRRVSSAYGAVSLPALDERYGGRRPFSYLRTSPYLGGVAIVCVLATAIGIAVVSDGRRTSPVAAGGAFPQPAYQALAVLGPQVGTSTSDYVRKADSSLIAAVQTSPERPRVALVSLLDYRTPEQADALLAGFTVARAFLRARAGGKLVAPLPVEVHGPLLAALRKAYQDTASSRAVAQRSYQGYVDSLRPKSAQDKAFRALYEAFARSSALEAQAYSHDCACVYAVLVTAPPAQLLSLRARPGVRAVEVAAASVVVAQVQVQPLLPEVVGVVPRPTVGGQP